ncbi:MAG: hypothetical protein J0H49_10765 [Acidobacteria bacterium]|nr:hypothetical protein [Acidobacteriota bacterium]
MSVCDIVFARGEEQILEVEQRFGLPRFTVGSPRQIQFGRSVRARTLPLVADQVKPEVLQAAIAVEDSTWWIACSKRTSAVEWLQRNAAKQGVC